MESGFFKGDEIKYSRYDEIKNFKCIGKYFEPHKMFNKEINLIKCPSCRGEITFFKRKGILKLKCDNCSYQTIIKAKDWNKRTEKQMNKLWALM